MIRATSLLVAFALAASACSDSPPAEEGGSSPQGEVLLEPAEPVDPIEIESSGRTLSGVFAEESPRPPAVAATWAFTASGGYARSSTITGGTVIRDAGSYTIDKTGRLVLYVEQRGDARYGTAVRYICELEGDPASVLVVNSPDTGSVRLVRTAGDPASGEAASAAK